LIALILQFYSPSLNKRYYIKYSNLLILKLLSRIFYYCEELLKIAVFINFACKNTMKYIMEIGNNK
jgi:hypothetical protein